ncbi:phosphate signaling complex PhoU family protein [Halobacterium jilantaiense]|uniref:Phosphate uptake regulator n=1 Tax=Halobacterium jilantaiense TaxID=355548 RepID=A0A1I0PLD2_9EURY|nr:AbrB/MazE/SpoVT family DNA-binding domain-containing protein [Halobacterium jilantaiense]SEW14628.1 Phosphate uptake regulator [Halobacterium jilantaiense]
METRKVQQVGGGTYTVSIPVHWANEHGVGAGDTAYLYPHSDGSLVVRWAERDHSALAATTVDLDGGTPAAAERALDAAYTAGFKRIELRAAGGLDDEQRRAIVDRARTLSGVGVTEEDDSAVVVQGLLDAGDVSIRQSVLQLRFSALSVHEQATAALAAAVPDVDRVLDRTRESDRLARLVARQANRALVDRSVLDALGLSRRRLAEYAVAARQLDRVAGHAAGVSRRVRDCDGLTEDVAAELSDLGEVARDVVDDATDALVDGGDREAAQTVHDRAGAVAAEGERVEQALVEREAAASTHLVRVLDHLLRTAACGERVAAAALRVSLQS